MAKDTQKNNALLGRGHVGEIRENSKEYFGTFHYIFHSFPLTSGFAEASESRCLISLAIVKKTCSTFKFVLALYRNNE